MHARTFGHNMDMSTKTLIRFVKEYEKWPVLWDPNHRLYRVAAAKFEAWKNISKVVKQDNVTLRRKLNSVLASHRREKMRVQRTGFSSWFLYNHLRFLPNHVPNSEEVTFDFDDDEKQSDGNRSDEHGTEIEMLEVDDPPLEEERLEAEFEYYVDKEDVSDSFKELHHEVSIKEEPTPKKTVKINIPKKKMSTKSARTVRNLKKQSPQIKENIYPQIVEEDLNEQYQNSLLNKDECDRFGEYIASSLKKHDERTRSMIKHAINNILFEQEMKLYNEPQYQVTMIKNIENPLTVDSNINMLDDDDDE